MTHHMSALEIKGYRPFRDFNASLGCLEVIAGANGSGKSSLFEFLKFLRNAAYNEIPPEIVSGSVGQRIFHAGGPERFEWAIEVDTGRRVPLLYRGELQGPVGRTQVTRESAKMAEPLNPRSSDPYIFMEMRGQEGVVQDPEAGGLKRQKIALKRPNQLALSAMTNPALGVLYELREYIRGWRFYNSFDINNRKIRQSVPIEQDPVLHEDAGNLSEL